jgi:hypothetical protein
MHAIIVKPAWHNMEAGTMKHGAGAGTSTRTRSRGLLSSVTRHASLFAVSLVCKMLSPGHRDASVAACGAWPTRSCPQTPVSFCFVLCLWPLRDDPSAAHSMHGQCPNTRGPCPMCTQLHGHPPCLMCCVVGNRQSSHVGSLCSCPSCMPPHLGPLLKQCCMHWVSCVQISKFDVQEKAVKGQWVPDGGAILSEPQVVQRPGATEEDDGVVIAPCVDGEGRCMVAILDAGAPAFSFAKCALPHRLPSLLPANYFLPQSQDGV